MVPSRPLTAGPHPPRPSRNRSLTGLWRGPCVSEPHGGRARAQSFADWAAADSTPRPADSGTGTGLNRVEEVAAAAAVAGWARPSR